MTKEEMMAKIANKRTDVDNEALRKQREKEAKCERIKAKLKELAPRINDLLDVAQELDRNGFHLGVKKSWDRTAEYVTGGIEHNFGFFTNENPYTGRFPFKPYAIGIEGGGCCGYGFEVSRDGHITRGLLEYDGRINSYANRFFELFDDFERRFYAYVESL